ncbi:MAG: glycosyltransferase family 2 protein [Armatimonadota bacterium]
MDRRVSEDPRVSVVVPAYNEADAIVECMEGLRAALDGADFSAEIVVVDDGSTDGTAEKLEQVEGIRLLQHDRNRGYGAALKTGIRSARGELIVITDSDGTYPVARIPELVAGMEQADMVVGARTGENVRIPALRKPAKWFITALASYLSESDIPDLNSGLRVFRRDDAIRLFGILPDGFSFTTTITLAMMSSGMRVDFVPIDYHQRTGHSKIRPFQDTWNFIVLILRTIALFNPLKVFLPAATVIGGLGLGIAIYDMIVHDNIYDAELLLIICALILGAIGMLADIVTRTRLFLVR